MGGVEVQLHASAVLPHESSPWYPMNRRIGGFQNLSPRIGEEKNR